MCLFTRERPDSTRLGVTRRVVTRLNTYDTRFVEEEEHWSLIDSAHSIPLHNHVSTAAEMHPLLLPEIVAEVFSHLVEGNLCSVAQSTEVCRLWWQSGHKHVWRRVQLRDLYCYVKNIERRHYFASLVQEISFEAGDTILADHKLPLGLLNFSRLDTINMWCSNIVGVRFANIDSLFVPSLHSSTIEKDDKPCGYESDEDVLALLDALRSRLATFTTLHFDVFSQDLASPVLYGMLDDMTAIEDLQSGRIAEEMHGENAPENLLQKMLADKLKLDILNFSHGVIFSLADISTFLDRMGRDWTIPSLMYFGRPRFDECHAAAYLINRMPNLDELFIGLDDRVGLWSDSLRILSTAISRCEQLKLVNMDIDLNERDMDGSWLPYSTGPPET
jgi:hypothetical protein